MAAGVVDAIESAPAFPASRPAKAAALSLGAGPSADARLVCAPIFTTDDWARVGIVRTGSWPQDYGWIEESNRRANHAKTAKPLLMLDFP